MSIRFPPIQARQAFGNTTQRDRSAWKAELRRQARATEQRDKAAFLKHRNGAI